MTKISAQGQVGFIISNRVESFKVYIYPPAVFVLDYSITNWPVSIIAFNISISIPSYSVLAYQKTAQKNLTPTGTEPPLVSILLVQNMACEDCIDGEQLLDVSQI